uniref:Uncharacterized protein n=1 Tax=Rhizophora mucronata TaxID=61149 RepID=A0A2P2N5P8_RHIMU
MLLSRGYSKQKVQLQHPWTSTNNKLSHTHVCHRINIICNHIMPE